MKSTSFRLLQIFLWCVCGFHVIVGVGLNVSDSFPSLMAGYYGAQVDWTSQFLYILKPLGIFMLVLGALAAGAALKPLENAMVVYGFVAIFLLRAGQRVVLRQDIYEAFGIAPARNMAAMTFFLVLGVALLSLYRYVNRTASQGQAP